MNLVFHVVHGLSCTDNGDVATGGARVKKDARRANVPP